MSIRIKALWSIEVSSDLYIVLCSALSLPDSRQDAYYYGQDDTDGGDDQPDS